MLFRSTLCSLLARAMCNRVRSASVSAERVTSAQSRRRKRWRRSCWRFGNPPILGFCPGDRADGTPKDTARNIRLTHEFVVNLVDEKVAEAMNRTAAALPYGVSELQSAGLTTAASSAVNPPRIAESPASLECKEWGTLQIGGNRLIIGLVKRVQVRDELFDPKTLRIRSEHFQVIGRMASPNWYCRTQDRFEMIRPD